MHGCADPGVTRMMAGLIRRTDDLDAHAGGFENLIEEASVPAESLAVPPPSVVPPENVAEILRRHGNEVLPG